MGFCHGSELGLLTKTQRWSVLVRKLVPKPYTKPSRYNLRLSLEQYQLLLYRKQKAKANGERIRYKDLIELWGIRQSVIGTALQRGIKQYDYILWKMSKENSLPRNAGALPLLRTTTTPFVQNNEQEQPR